MGKFGDKMMNKKEFRKSCMLINAGITDKHKKSALICDKLINYQVNYNK